ncbi:MAG: CdaR family protein [Anaerolineaceae bacterium]
MSILRSIWKNIPTFLLAFALSITIWISAVTENDPTEERIYSKPVTVELIGQDPNLVLTNTPEEQLSLTMRAPASVWDQLNRENSPVRAVVDLSGLEPGTHNLPVQVQIAIRPIEIVSYSPSSLDVSLEVLSNQSFPIQITQRGEPGVGYEAAEAAINPTVANVSGPESLVKKVTQVRAVLDLNNATEDINRSLVLQALDANESVINGLTITPDKIDLNVSVTQRGGYRNVVVKVVVNGIVAPGYRVTNISVFPPAITVFSSDPRLVDNLPGYVETTSLDLTGAKDDLDEKVPLLLPAGISVVGDQLVEVQVGVAAIEGSQTFENMRITIIGLENGLQATASPDVVDVIVSGPLPELEKLTAQNIQIILDLTGEKVGKINRTPRVEFPSEEIRLESLLPSSIEITISKIGTTNP